MSQGAWIAVLGLLCILFGVSYIAWGNWIPFAATVNSPTAAGIYGIGVGVAFVGWGVYDAKNPSR